MRETYAKWMTSPDNPRFTTVIVNRLWKRLMRVGLIEPLDNLTVRGSYGEGFAAPTLDIITQQTAFAADTVFDPAPIQEHTVGLSGGNELARFNLSVNYLDHQGMTPNTEADRIGARLKERKETVAVAESGMSSTKRSVATRSCQFE